MNEDKDERKIHDVSHDSLDLPLSKRNDETVIGTPSTPTSQMRNMKKDSGGRRRRQNTRGSLRLKKAPGAPRRFRSAFIFFSTSKHQEFRTKILVQHGAGFGKSNSKEKTTLVAKAISKAWRQLSPAEREVWEEKARIDKQRFELEKAMYRGPWKVEATAGRKAPKDPNAPKKPVSAFLAFSNSKRGWVTGRNPGATNAQVSKILSTMWKAAPPEVKQTYIDREAKLREKYKRDIAKWRADHDQKQRQAFHLKQSRLMLLQSALPSTGLGQVRVGPMISASQQLQHNVEDRADHVDVDGSCSNEFSATVGESTLEMNHPYQCFPSSRSSLEHSGGEANASSLADTSGELDPVQSLPASQTPLDNTGILWQRPSTFSTGHSFQDATGNQLQGLRAISPSPTAALSLCHSKLMYARSFARGNDLSSMELDGLGATTSCVRPWSQDRTGSPHNQDIMTGDEQMYKKEYQSLASLATSDDFPTVGQHQAEAFPEMLLGRSTAQLLSLSAASAAPSSSSIGSSSSQPFLSSTTPNTQSKYDHCNRTIAPKKEENSTHDAAFFFDDLSNHGYSRNETMSMEDFMDDLFDDYDEPSHRS